MGDMSTKVDHKKDPTLPNTADVGKLSQVPDPWLPSNILLTNSRPGATAQQEAAAVAAGTQGLNY